MTSSLRTWIGRDLIRINPAPAAPFPRRAIVVYAVCRGRIGVVYAGGGPVRSPSAGARTGQKKSRREAGFLRTAMDAVAYAACFH